MARKEMKKTLGFEVMEERLVLSAAAAGVAHAAQVAHQHAGGATTGNLIAALNHVNVAAQINRLNVLLLNGVLNQNNIVVSLVNVQNNHVLNNLLRHASFLNNSLNNDLNNILNNSLNNNQVLNNVHVLQNVLNGNTFGQLVGLNVNVLSGTVNLITVH